MLYQVYPRSFKDSNGDGIGDLNGITEKLPYIASLGVDGVWICPFFPSPMKDFGYDVSDYYNVDPLFGTLEDFKALLKTAQSLNLKIIIDLVLSHTSDQHPWFTDHQDYYVWADGKNGGPPNNWVSVFGGSAWTWHEERQQYYLHNFLPSQPDLNIHNPAVQNEMLAVAHFWLALGVDGFRLDVVNFYCHDPLLRDNPPRPPALGSATQFEGADPYSAQHHIYDKSRPETLAFLRRLRALMDQYPNRFTIGEIGDDSPYERAVEYTGKGLLDTTYNPQMMSGAHKALRADQIRTPLETFARHATQDHWPAWAFSNHDVVRAASRWHSTGDGFSHDPRLSKLLIALLLCLRGTVFLYQGEELGLPEAALRFENLQDPWGKHLWPAWQGRDGCRTPFPWDSGLPHAGFSTGTPWLPVPESHKTLCQTQQDATPDSTLTFTRDFLRWRQTQTALQEGTLAFHDTGTPALLAFTRTHDTDTLLCLFNLSDRPQQWREISLNPYCFHIK